MQFDYLFWRVVVFGERVSIILGALLNLLLTFATTAAANDGRGRSISGHRV